MFTESFIIVNVSVWLVTAVGEMSCQNTHSSHDVHKANACGKIIILQSACLNLSTAKWLLMKSGFRNP